MSLRNMQPGEWLNAREVSRKIQKMKLSRMLLQGNLTEMLPVQVLFTCIWVRS